MHEYIFNVFEGAVIQLNVIRALYYRELLTRVNKTQFGIIGLYFDPFLSYKNGLYQNYSL